MAIDDNTSYELTGAQVKDLANKIKGKAADNTFVGATPSAPGSKGLVPGPQAGDNTKFLSGDGTWQTPPAVNNGALTIQQNGTTLDTFTANSSDDKTVNIQTITAETVAPAEEVGAITTNMIADGAVTSAKVDWSTLGYKTGTANTASSSIVDKIVLSGLDTSATYLAIGEIWINNTSDSLKDFDAYIVGSTTEEHLKTTQLWWNNFSFHSVVKPGSNAQIKLRYNSNGIAPNRARLTVIRIG